MVSDDVPSTQSGVPPPERPVHKYPKWEEQVYNSIKNSGFVLNQPSHDLGMLPVDKNPLKFPQGMSTVCNEIEKSFEDKTQGKRYSLLRELYFDTSESKPRTMNRLIDREYGHCYLNRSSFLPSIYKASHD